MSSTITHNNLKKIIANQKKFKNNAPVTSRATFKLSALESFLKEIEKLKKNEPDEMRNHNICITFVREIYLKGKMESDLGYSFSSYTHGEIWEDGITEDNEKFSQLIPIIVGCECKLDEHYKTKSFKFIRNADGLIPFVRPGGEGSGLIPPPPNGDDDV